MQDSHLISTALLTQSVTLLVHFSTHNRLAAGQIPQQLEGWADKFGGQYELFLFGTRRIMVVDPDESRLISSRRPAGFGRGPNSVSVSAQCKQCYRDLELVRC